MKWDDLKCLMAVHRTGTIAAAAQQMGLNQVTLGRRLRRLEQTLGESLLLRVGPRLSFTEAGLLAIRHAERMEFEAERLGDVVRASTHEPSGIVRVAAMSWVVNHVLFPALPAFHVNHPGIELQIVTGTHQRGLSRREIDLSLRFGRSPSGREACRTVGHVPYACYSRKDAVVGDVVWVGYGEGESHGVINRRMEESLHGATIAVRVGNADAAYNAIRRGVGRGLIPETLGERDPMLVRLSGPEPELVRELTLVFHPDIGGIARMATTITWIEATLKRLDEFLG